MRDHHGWSFCRNNHAWGMVAHCQALNHSVIKLLAILHRDLQQNEEKRKAYWQQLRTPWKNNISTLHLEQVGCQSKHSPRWFPKGPLESWMHLFPANISRMFNFQEKNSRHRTHWHVHTRLPVPSLKDHLSLTAAVGNGGGGRQGHKEMI